mgnify:FL=1
MTCTLFVLQGEYRGNLVSTGCAFAFRTWVEGKVDTIGIASLVVIIPQVSCEVNEISLCLKSYLFSIQAEITSIAFIQTILCSFV